jgi:hypothetical protein
LLIEILQRLEATVETDVINWITRVGQHTTGVANANLIQKVDIRFFSALFKITAACRNAHTRAFRT